jgi:ATP-binding cassette subfamily C protein
MVTGIVSLMQICLAFWISPPITLFTLASGSLLFVFLNKLMRQSQQAGRDLMGFNREMFAEMHECLGGMKEIKNYALEERQVDRFRGLNRKVVESVVSLTRIQTRTEMFYKSGAALVISLYFYVAVGVLRMAPAQLIVIIVLFSRLWPRLSSFQRGLQQMAGMLPAFAALTRLYGEAFAAGEPVDHSDGGRGVRLKDGVEFNGVCFRYPGSPESPPTIRAASFVIPAFKMTALTGSSGAGKSTLADLLTGLLKPDRGVILIDGKPLTDANLHGWRNSIGYVPQEPFLLHKSIRDNLLWATPGAAESALWEALRLAAAEEFVRRLPEGLDTVVGDRGTRLSGGERQRIVLARALLRKPSLLILDEATSALDGENEKRIQDALGLLRGKLTIVVIAHRLSTIRQADHVIVLEKGKVQRCLQFPGRGDSETRPRRSKGQ